VGVLVLFGWLTMSGGESPSATADRVAAVVKRATADAGRAVRVSDEGRVTVDIECRDGVRRQVWRWQQRDAGLRILAPSPRSDRRWLALPAPLPDRAVQRLGELFGPRPWC